MADDLKYEEQVALMKKTIQSFSPNDFRALTRRIKPCSLDLISRTLLEVCAPDASEEVVIAALSTIVLPRGEGSHYYTVHEKEVLLWEAWSQPTKKTGRNE
jgi:hypothetical protein